MTTVITGIGGLLGRELASQARRIGHRVIGVARRPHPDLAGLADQLVIEDLAIGTRQDWRVLAGEAVVFHLAADTQIYGSGEGFQRDNVRTTISACDIARQTGGRLVFFSSSAVYSGPGTIHPVTALSEHAATQPASTYGRSKKAAEAFIAQAGLSAMVLRIFGVLSERLITQPARGNLVQAIARSLDTGEEVTLGIDAAGRSAVRDYVMDEDVCSLALRAGEILVGGEAVSHRTRIVNICTGIPTSTLELADAAQTAAGRTFPLRLEKRRSNENGVMLGDTATLQSMFGYVPPSRVHEFWERVAARALVRALCGAENRLCP